MESNSIADRIHLTDQARLALLRQASAPAPTRLNTTRPCARALYRSERIN